MKTCLIGVSNNITQHFDKINVWAKSFRRYSTGDVFLLCINSTDRDLELCEQNNIIPVPVVIEDIYYVYHKRFKIIADFIRSTDMDLYLLTDVFDVLFQGDPFKKLDADNYDIFISGEGLLVSQESWNRDSIGYGFPEYYANCAQREIVCSGIIGGKKNALINLSEHIFNLGERSKHNQNALRDQAALNCIVAENMIENIKIFNLHDGWAVHCAVAGPTPYFNNFKDNLKYNIPYLKDSIVYTHDGYIYDIVHQHNRTDWNDTLLVRARSY